MSQDGSVGPTCGFLQCTNTLFLQRKNPERSPAMESRNLAARVGRWSAHHRKAAIIGWVLFVVLAVVGGGKIGHNDLDESATGSGESKRGDMIVKAAGFPQRATEQVLVQGAGSGATAQDVITRLRAIHGVSDIDQTVSKDGRSLLVDYALRGSDEHAKKLIAQPLAALAAVRAAHPGVRVEPFGAVSA